MAYNNRRISIEELENVARTPILPLEDLNSPLVVESIQLLRKEQEYLVHVRSTAGSEGISVANSHVEQLYPILNQRVIPYFIGKDVRGLEGHLFELYRYKSNYKLILLATYKYLISHFYSLTAQIFSCRFGIKLEKFHLAQLKHMVKLQKKLNLGRVQ